MSRDDALEQKRTVELLFSSHGPILRDDKYLKGNVAMFSCVLTGIICRHLFDI